MPASKFSHVLSVLRKNLALRQTELAKMVGCSVNTITSIEVGRLKLSESLARRIAVVTGCDEQWLLANDISVPIPKRPFYLAIAAAQSSPAAQRSGHFRWEQQLPGGGGSRERIYVYTIYLLIDVFSRLFAEARKLEKTSIRNVLEDCIRRELVTLEKTQTEPDARPLYSVSKDTLRLFHKQHFKLPTELLNLGIDLEYMIETSPESKSKSPAREQKIDQTAPSHREAPKQKKERQLL
jgi:DNA-binding XRE family transcriptional regulator